MGSYTRVINPQRDANERDVVRVLESYGAYVIRGEEIDLFAHLFGEWFAIEVKVGKAKLRPNQVELQARCHGNTYVCRGTDDAHLIAQDRKRRAVQSGFILGRLEINVPVREGKAAV